MTDAFLLKVTPAAFVLPVVLGYLIGAIPFGVVLGKTLKGIDVRDYGSGKIGTANVTRSLGWRIGILVLVLDLGKGIAAVLLARALGAGVLGENLVGIAAVVGHNWSIFIRFGGGRGVTTGLGGLWAISPPVGAVAMFAGFLTMALTRYVSLGSIVGAVIGGLGLIAMIARERLASCYLLYALVVAPLVVMRHRDNISRLLKGQERRIGQKAELRGAPGDSQSGPSNGTTGLGA